MATELKLMIDMVAVLGSASLGGYLANRLGQPVLVGYLLGGMIVGPAGFKLIDSESDIQTLAEIGVALLLFALGIEFSLADLIRVRRIALGGGSLQVMLTILLGGGLPYLVGWVDTIPQALFLGSVLSLSSTAVVLKSLIERNEVQTAQGQAMLAILIVQDLGLGLMLAVLPALTESPDQLGFALLEAVARAGIFMVGALAAGYWVIPPLMQRIAQTGSQELFIVCVFSICLGVALVSAWIGLGIEMGAFVAGLMISQVDYSDHALDRVLPMRDVFATLFFASIGTLINPVFLFENAPILVGFVAVVMLGKAIITTPIVALLGFPLKTALIVGLGINQIGEFSFVLAGVAQDLGLFSPELYGLTVGTTAVTLVLTPFTLRASPLISDQLQTIPWLKSWLRDRTAHSFQVSPGLSDHVVVAGFGRVGQTLVRLLLSQGNQVLVIDNNEAMIQPIRNIQIPYVFGDASSDLVLEKAYIKTAKAMAIALPDPVASRLTLKRALSQSPDLDITVRAHENKEIDVLYQLGAREVVQPEFEASLEMGSHMLIGLGSPTGKVRQVIDSFRLRRYLPLMPETINHDVISPPSRAIEGLEGRWYQLKTGSPLEGSTLGEANIRRLTGATIMEIRRGGQTFAYPGPEVIFKDGDRLFVIGNPEERQAFEHLLRIDP